VRRSSSADFGSNSEGVTAAVVEAPRANEVPVGRGASHAVVGGAVTPCGTRRLRTPRIDERNECVDAVRRQHGVARPVEQVFAVRVPQLQTAEQTVPHRTTTLGDGATCGGSDLL
jgi:hypothetical protein